VPRRGCGARCHPPCDAEAAVFLESQLELRKSGRKRATEPRPSFGFDPLFHRRKTEWDPRFGNRMFGSSSVFLRQEMGSNDRMSPTGLAGRASLPSVV
jgi:hypothetical protein